MSMRFPFVDSYFPPIDMSTVGRPMFRYTDLTSRDCGTCMMWEARYKRLGMDYREVSKLCDAVMWENIGVKEEFKLVQKGYEAELQRAAYQNNALTLEISNYKNLIEEMKKYAKWRENQMHSKLEEEGILRERIEVLKEKVKDERKTVESLKKETLDQAAELDDEKYNKAEMKETIETIRHETVDTVSALEILKKEHAVLKKEMEEEYESLKKKHEDLTKQYLETKVENDQLKEETTNLKANLEKELSYDTLKKKYENLRLLHRKMKKDSAEQLKKQLTKTSTQRQENTRLSREFRGLTLQLEATNRDYIALQDKYQKELARSNSLAESESRLMSDMRIMQKHRVAQEAETEERMRRAFVAAADLERFKAKEYAPLKQELGDLQKELGKRRTAIDDLRKELKQVKSEKDELLRRLSEITASRLVDGNPHIADLSNERRPTKLAEEYGELYNNEWTEALEEQMALFQKDEQTAVAHLLKIVTRVHSACQEVSKKYLDNLLEAATQIPRKQGGSVSLTGDGANGPLPANLNMTIRQVRALMALHIRRFLSKDLQKIWVEENLDLGTRTDNYVTKCLEICLDMSVTNPPVVLMPLPANGSDVDKENYRFYTESGTVVKYVVWPAMTLYKDGPIMVKGVVQGERL